jgi:hypothetical protein
MIWSASFWSQDSSVSIVAGYGLDDWGFIPAKGKRFSVLQCPDQLWGSLSLLSSGYRGLVPWG